MRILKLVCIVLMAMLISAAFISCSKSRDDLTEKAKAESSDQGAASENASPTIHGLWTGHYHATDKSTAVAISFLIKDDGTLELTLPGKQQAASGEWKLKGTSFEANVTLDGKPRFFTGEVNTALSWISGSWSQENKTQISGSWYIGR